MGYLIKYGDIRYVREKSSPDIGKTIEALLKLKEKITELIEANRFRGKSADSIKIYMQDVHFSLINSIIGLLQLYYDKLLLYCDDYYQYDSDKNAVIPESEIDFLLNDIPTRITSFQTCCSYFSADVRCIGDLFDPNNPDISFIERDIKGVLEKLKSYKSGVEYHESIHKDVSDMETLLNSINASINEYDSKARSRLLTYNEGDYFKSPNTFNLFESSKVLEDFYSQRGIEGKLQAANEHQVEVYKQLEEDKIARERIRNGINQSILAAITIVVGSITIVATAGAATPIFAVVLAASGTSSVAYGFSELGQGHKEIKYGQNGDAYTKSGNFIRDTVFHGNQKAYKIWGIANTTVAGLAVPANISAGTAMSFGSSVPRAVITEVGKGTISLGAAYGTDKVLEKCGASDFERFVGSLSVAMLTYGGLNKLDANLNVSGFNKAPKAPKVQSEVNTEIPKLQDNVNGEVPKIKGEGVVDTVKGTSSTRPYTKSSLKMGQEMHKAYKADVVDNITKFKEFRLPSGKRIDFIDFETKTIYELKPYNPNGIKTGLKQLEVYLKEVESIYGGGWKTILDTY